MTARAFVRKAEREQEDQSGAREYFKGDLFDRESLRRAFAGVDRVMHISPPHIPGEFAIGQTMIELSSEHHVRQFALLSAIHPFIDALPAHRMKLLVQQYLIDSGLPFTILQPTVLMQNTPLGEVLKSGILSVPYSIDPAHVFRGPQGCCGSCRHRSLRRQSLQGDLRARRNGTDYRP
jgi:uncharacterized protein YbjT (DUF2867 family)